MENIDKHMKIAIVGLGCGGVRMLNAITLLPAAAKLHLFAIDTDAATLAHSLLPLTNQLLADPQWRRGRGCGGDPLKGQSSITRERAVLEQKLTGFDYVFVLGGLGGGLATGAVVPLTDLLSKLKIPTIHLLTLPFSWEGQARHKVADSAIGELLPVADSLILLPNDLLFSLLLPSTLAASAFDLADSEVAKALIAIVELLLNGNVVSLDFADISAALRNKKSFCSIGVGIASMLEGANAPLLAVDRLLASPLLGGVAKLREADTVILSVVGGPELSISQVQQCLGAVEKCYGEQVNLVAGVNTSAEYAGCVLASAIAIKYIEKRKVKPRRHSGIVEEPQLIPENAVMDAAGPEQMPLPLTIVPVEKGIFFNSVQVTFNGEDLDVPAFQRREILIDRGEKA